MIRTSTKRVSERPDARRLPRTIRVDLTPRTMLVVAVAVGAAWLLIALFPIVLVVVIGLMIAGAVAPLVASLERKRIGRGVAVAIVFGGMLATTALLGILTVPRLASQFTGLVAITSGARARAACEDLAF